jgi:hypothetical protein
MLKISNKLIAMLNSLPKYSQTVFNVNPKHSARNLRELFENYGTDVMVLFG